MARPTVRSGPSRTRSAIVQTRRVTCSRPVGLAERTSSRARSTSARITRARSARTRPAGVSSAPRGVRSKSVTPRSRSNARICWESDGAATCNRRAAEEKRRSSATVRKYLSWRRSTGQVTAGEGEARGRRVRSGLTGLWFYVTAHAVVRSEEHTSELQSRQYLVCRLLLEKKNKL